MPRTGILALLSTRTAYCRLLSNFITGLLPFPPERKLLVAGRSERGPVDHGIGGPQTLANYGGAAGVERPRAGKQPENDLSNGSAISSFGAGRIGHARAFVSGYDKANTMVAATGNARRQAERDSPRAKKRNV